ncbi:MAG TPA: J domain-containing protein [Actinomycetota bacterium]|jgi:molecular chaperone DnaJ|nr:J domain-containing protein [Actinomycetota bacterium]
MPTDYYEVLGVSPEAAPDDIKQAFRRLAREHHPDATGGDSTSEQRYKEISEAYAVLSDEGKRRQYDAARLGVGQWSSPWGSPFASTIEDIFETFFGGSVGRTATRQQTRSRHGEPIEIELAVTLEEVVFGAERSLRFDRFEPCERCAGEGTEPGTHADRCDQCGGTGQVQQARRTILGSLITAHPCRTCSGSGWVVPDPCKDCRGAGRVARDIEVPVTIPGGIDTGDRLRVSGEGEAGTAGGSRGDLYVHFRVEGDERFERVGDDLYTWAEIPLTTAALGGTVTVPTLDGDEELDIPGGTQSGTVLRLKSLGVPKRSGRGRGQLVVRVHVVTPDRLGKKEKELLKELAALRGEDGKKNPKSRLRRVLGSD